MSGLRALLRRPLGLARLGAVLIVLGEALLLLARLPSPGTPRARPRTTDAGGTAGEYGVRCERTGHPRTGRERRGAYRRNIDRMLFHQERATIVRNGSVWKNRTTPSNRRMVPPLTDAAPWAGQDHEVETVRTRYPTGRPTERRRPRVRQCTTIVEFLFKISTLAILPCDRSG